MSDEIQGIPRNKVIVLRSDFDDVDDTRKHASVARYEVSNLPRTYLEHSADLSPPTDVSDVDDRRPTAKSKHI
jgi:hypothetical protein